LYVAHISLIWRIWHISHSYGTYGTYLTHMAHMAHIALMSCMWHIPHSCGTYGTYLTQHIWHIWHISHSCLVALLSRGTLVSVQSYLMYRVMGVTVMHHGILVSSESCLMGVTSHKIHESWGKSQCDSLLQDICNGARMHLRNTCSRVQVTMIRT